MSDNLRAELAAAARRLGMTDEVVGRMKPLFEVAYSAGLKDARQQQQQQLPRPVAKGKGERP